MSDTRISTALFCSQTCFFPATASKNLHEKFFGNMKKTKMKARMHVHYVKVESWRLERYGDQSDSQLRMMPII